MQNKLRPKNPKASQAAIDLVKPPVFGRLAPWAGPSHPSDRGQLTPLQAAYINNQYEDAQGVTPPVASPSWDDGSTLWDDGLTLWDQ